MAKKQTLKSEEGNIIYPYSLDECIFDTDGNRLDNKMTELKGKLTNIVKTKDLEDTIELPITVDADMLGGYKANDYVKKSEAINETDVLSCIETKMEDVFTKVRNLFDGNFVDLYISGSNTSNATLSANTTYYALCVDIEPNTTYTILKDAVAKQGNYYYFKVATSTHTKNEVLLSPKTVEINFISANTASDTNNYTFTSGENDKSVIVVVCNKTIDAPYVEVLKGTYTDFQVNSYEDIKIVPNNLEVYNKSEVDTKILNVSSKGNIKYSNGNYIVALGKAQYVIMHQISETRALDTWRIYSGGIGDTTNMFVDTDIEAPIKEKDTTDFCGGFHGDETFTDASLIIDGKIYTLGDSFNVDFDSMNLFVTSDIFHCDTTIKSFTRYKKLTFQGNTLTVENRWDCVDDFIVERYCGCGLFSIYSDLLTHYCKNTDLKLKSMSDAIDTSVSKDFNKVVLYGNDFTFTMEVLSNNHQDNYQASIVDFTTQTPPRLKVYFDAIASTNGVTLTSGDSLQASFKIEIV